MMRANLAGYKPCQCNRLTCTSCGRRVARWRAAELRRWWLLAGFRRLVMVTVTVDPARFPADYVLRRGVAAELGELIWRLLFAAKWEAAYPGEGLSSPVWSAHREPHTGKRGGGAAAAAGYWHLHFLFPEPPGGAWLSRAELAELRQAVWAKAGRVRYGYRSRAGERTPVVADLDDACEYAAKDLAAYVAKSEFDAAALDAFSIRPMTRSSWLSERDPKAQARAKRDRAKRERLRELRAARAAIVAGSMPLVSGGLVKRDGAWKHRELQRIKREERRLLRRGPRRRRLSTKEARDRCGVGVQEVAGCELGEDGRLLRVRRSGDVVQGVTLEDVRDAMMAVYQVRPEFIEQAGGVYEYVRLGLCDFNGDIRRGRVLVPAAMLPLVRAELERVAGGRGVGPLFDGVRDAELEGPSDAELAWVEEDAMAELAWAEEDDAAAWAPSAVASSVSLGDVPVPGVGQAQSNVDSRTDGGVDGVWASYAAGGYQRLTDGRSGASCYGQGNASPWGLWGRAGVRRLLVPGQRAAWRGGPGWSAGGQRGYSCGGRSRGAAGRGAGPRFRGAGRGPGPAPRGAILVRCSCNVGGWKVGGGGRSPPR